MQLIVEHEQVFGRRRLGECRRLVELRLADREELSIDLVHGEQRSRDAARPGQKLPPADPQLFARCLRQLGDSRFDLLLLPRLRHGHVLAVADHPRRHRRNRLAHIGPLTHRHLLLFEQPMIVLPNPPRFVPFHIRHDSPPAARCAICNALRPRPQASPAVGWISEPQCTFSRSWCISRCSCTLLSWADLRLLRCQLDRLQRRHLQRLDLHSWHEPRQPQFGGGLLPANLAERLLQAGYLVRVG